MEKGDGLSEIICKRCLARLQVAYDFKNEAISSNRELRSFISDVNKQFQQVTSSGSSNNTGLRVSKKRARKSSQTGGSESDDELDEDIRELITDEYREIDGELSDENVKAIDREQLVEILGDNSATTVRKTRSMRSVKEDPIDESPESMEVFLVDENSEVDPNYIVYDYEQQTAESITDESEEPQFLEDEENEEQDENEVKEVLLYTEMVCRILRIFIISWINLVCTIFFEHFIQSRKRILKVEKRHKSQKAAPVRVLKIDAINATKRSAQERIWPDTKSHTRVESHTFARSAATHSLKMVHWNRTWWGQFWGIYWNILFWLIKFSKIYVSFS